MWRQRFSALAAFLKAHRTQALALLFSLGVTAAILAFRRQIADLAGLGYLGVFLISLLGNATVVVPVPSLAVVFAGGSVLNPLLVGLVAGIAEPLGELSGYLAGYGGSAVISNSPRFEQIKGWMQRRGFLTILVLAAIPNPVFDLAGVAAGMLHYPVSRFLVACWIGKTCKALALAYLGRASTGLLGKWFAW
ncbi:MAG: hypothetical protein GX557_03365 [Chloroflexi bacterium]|nr:hypothetical protein [Chloroflexota bacterium]